jgi:hypothetical protein
MLKLMRDSFVVSKMLESFQISDYYTQTYSSEEVIRFADFLDYVKVVKEEELPFVPILYLWRVFIMEILECDVEFNKCYIDEFIEQLEIWAEEAHDKCYTENKI